MSKRVVAIRVAAVAAVAAAGFGVTLVAGGGGGSSVRTVSDPHGGTIGADRLQRIVQAAQALSQTATRTELAARGERLFNSPASFRTGESCASCHVLGGAVNGELGVIVHTRDPSKPLSPDNFTGLRQAPALWDVAETAPYNWIGGNPTLEAQATGAIKTHFCPGGPVSPPATCTGQGAPVTPKPEDVAAIAAYLRTLHAPVTRHDQGRLTPTELAGEEVFVGKGGCIACHGGPQFTDNLIHNTGVTQPAVEADADPGAVPGVPHGFNTPTLRDIRNTAPYMHNGSEKTLDDVVDFYNNRSPLTSGPNGLRLTGPEKAELVAYLKTL